MPTAVSKALAHPNVIRVFGHRNSTFGPQEFEFLVSGIRVEGCMGMGGRERACPPPSVKRSHTPMYLRLCEVAIAVMLSTCSACEPAESYLCKARRLLYHSTLGLRIIKKKNERKRGKSGPAPRVCIAFAPQRITRRILKLAPAPNRYISQFKNNRFAEMCSGSEAGSYLRLIDFCISQL